MSGCCRVSTKQFLRLTKKLDRFHMLRWNLHPQERVGIFFVKKNN